MKDTSKLNPSITKLIKPIESQVDKRQMAEAASLAIEITEDKLRRRGLRGLLGDIRTLGSLLRCGVTGRFPVGWKTLTLIGTGLVYLFCPVDAVPDVIPVAGLADDAAVLAAIIGIVRNTLNEFREWEEHLS